MIQPLGLLKKSVKNNFFRFVTRQYKDKNNKKAPYNNAHLDRVS